MKSILSLRIFLFYCVARMNCARNVLPKLRRALVSSARVFNAHLTIFIFFSSSVRVSYSLCSRNTSLDNLSTRGIPRLQAAQCFPRSNKSSLARTAFPPAFPQSLARRDHPRVHSTPHLAHTFSSGDSGVH